MRAAIERLARRSGNTLTVSRKRYVHPEILTSDLDGALAVKVERRADAALSSDLANLKPGKSR